MVKINLIKGVLMKVRSLLTSFALVASSVTIVSAKEVIRVNEAGYFPNAQKTVVLMSDSSLAGKEWTVVSKDGNTVANGNVVENGLKCKGSTSPFDYNYKIDISDVNTIGDYSFVVNGNYKELKVSSDNYKSIVESTIRWLRVQRSGSNETLDHVPSHFGDSACVIYRKKDPRSNEWDNWIEDPNEKKVNILGGWYSDGTYTKFTSATAFTTYYLLSAYVSNPSFFEKKYSKSDLVDILDEAKFGLDYLMKVMPDDNTFVLEVGGFDGDFGVRLPEKDLQEGKRNAYCAFSIPQMGLTISALAKGAEVFKSLGKTDLAQQYQDMAIKIYKKALSKNWPNTWMEKDYELYVDKTRYDNFTIASYELYKLTNDSHYKSQAIKYAKKAKPQYWPGWANQFMVAHSLMYNDVNISKEYLKDELNDYANYAKRKCNIWGFPIEPTTTSLYLGMDIAIGAAKYREVTGDTKYDNLILNTINYTFGVNNWGVSFVASPLLENSVNQFNMQIYKLQKHLFPEGAVALGPCDRPTHDAEAVWILDDVRVNYCYPYNTDKIVFLDHEDDYMTMDSWIVGAADNIYLLTLATTLFGK